MRLPTIQDDVTPSEILYATTNDAKLKVMRSILGPRFKIISLNDAGIDSQTEEDGLNPKENALKKARYCFKITGKPSFSMDFGFFIEGLPDEEQPGPSVKRIIPISNGSEPSDEDVIEYYKNIVTRFGGRVNAFWLRALAYVSHEGEFIEQLKIPKTLVAIPSNNRKKGFPMTSLQIDALTGKYECDLTDQERALGHKAEDAAVQSFVLQHSGISN